MTNLRVLYVIDSLSRSGAEQSLASMAPHLLHLGVHLEVAYLVERPGLHEDFRAAGVPLHAITYPRSRPARVKAIRDLIRVRQPELVHTTLFEADIAGRIAAKLARVPSVSSLVNVAYGPEQRADRAISPARLAAARWADRLTAKLPVRFHAITEHVAAEMAATLGIPRDRVDVIPRGRDRDALGERSPARRAAVRAKLGVADGDVLLLAAARHEYQKGLDVLIEAMPRIVAANPRSMLLVAGREGKQTESLRAQISRFDLEQRVRLLGMRRDVPDLMVAADLFIMPSRWEGFGGVLLEAMALETPIVSANLAPLREVLAETGAYFAANDAMSLAAAVTNTLGASWAAAEQTGAALRRYEERYSAAGAAAAMANFYAEAPRC